MEYWRWGAEALVLISTAVLMARISRLARRLGQVPCDARAAGHEDASTAFNSEVASWRERTETQLRVLTKICDQARIILERGRVQHPRFVSDEAMEIRGMVERSTDSATMAVGEAPPVTEPQAAVRAQRGSEVTASLKSLLRDQLA